MEKLYSYKGAFPYPLPIDMENYEFDDFVLAPEKPITQPGQKLGWENNTWVVLDPSYSEVQIQWDNIRNQRNALLNSSDIKILRLLETSEGIPSSLRVYRQQLRDITNQENPFAIVWPKWGEAQ